MSDRPPDDTGTGSQPETFRWWFEDEIDEELEAAYLGTTEGGVADVRRREPPPEVAPPDEPPTSALDLDLSPPEVVGADVDLTIDAPAGPEEIAPPTDDDVAEELEDDEELGHRVAERRQRRRRRRRRAMVRVGVLLSVVAAVVAAVLVVPWDRLRRETPQPAPTAARTEVVAAPQQDTMLLIRTPADDRAPALGLTLLAAQEGSREASVIFIPEGTIVDVPGFGQDRLGLAHQYGGPALVEASLENLLGVDIDHTAAVSNSGLAAFLARTGGLDIELEEQLVSRTAAGAARVRFEPGAQFLDGERLVELWEFRQRGESELDTFPRQQLVWGELLAAAADEQVVEALTADGAPQLQTSANNKFLAGMLTRMAQAQDAGTLNYTLLPVTPFGARDETGASTYRPDPEGVTRLIQGPLRASVPEAGDTQGVRVQVLNGVGTPGIGQDVDKALEGAGFRIVLTENARSFDFEKTRILIYAEDERSLLAAEEVQRRLGVGTIQVSRQPQSVVDLTIVVGADFTAKNDADGDPFPTEEQSS